MGLQLGQRGRQSATRCARRPVTISQARPIKGATFVRVEVGDELDNVGGLDHTIGIEEQNKFGTHRQPLATNVVSGAKSQIRLRDNLDVRKAQRPDDGDGVVGGSVVDDNDARQIRRRQRFESVRHLECGRVSHYDDTDTRETRAVHLVSMSDPSPTSAGADIVVLLGTSWARLKDQNTRWRAVLDAWAADDRVSTITVVDFPSMTLGNLRRPRARALASWDPRITAVTGRVVLSRRPNPLDRLAWRTTGAALNSVLAPARGHRVALAATPLWAPVLRYLRADRRGFDAVDDWRALPAVARIKGHVEAGYRAAAAAADSASAVSPTLNDRLRHDFGIDATTVANGVALDQFVGLRADPPAGLPQSPFALYIGVVQERVDVDLLRAAATVMPVVVAGPVHPTMQSALAHSGLTLLGAVPVHVVPGLVRTATVGLIPHRINSLTASMDPMKLREYLAAGLPVVTTIEPPPELHSERVFVAAADAFAGAVESASGLPRLDEPDPAVSHRTWKSVADELFDVHVS